MQNVTFELTGEFVALTGVVDSGGAGKVMVANGAVSVDGRIETRKTCKIRAGQTVSVDGVRIRVRGA